MTETRSVPLADVLSVTTPNLLSARQMDGLTGLLNWMTGDELEMWQLPRAADECAPALIMQHPVLEGLAPPPGCSKPALRVWLSSTERQHGTHLDVARISHWVHQDPVQEFRDRVELVNLPTTSPKTG
ncbi:hypothetical protein AB0L83_22160 [Streptomyces sp. NPDC052071]|uniref:DUF7736 domain-containing protein n=1 Tax=Streptomyces TaxID=1883 RepID=UPI003449A68B|nr:hypothetical protein OG337_29230 [[Kitasatospora] papulosa]